MIIPKEAVFDRIEQTTSFFSKNFFSLFLPIFLYYFIIGTVFSLIASYFSIWYLGDQFFIDLKDSLVGVNSSLDIFNILYLNPKVIVLFSSSMFIFLLFTILVIPFTLGLIRSIHQAYNDKKITIRANLTWGITRIVKSFQTYWYMFMYAYMLPALIFIAFGFSFLFFDGFDNYQTFLLPFSIFILVTIFYVVYRGVKIVFSMISAASSDEFSTENFDYSVAVTKGNWWRIFGNMIMMGIIVSIVLSIGSGIIKLIISTVFPGALMQQLNGSIIDLMSNQLTGSISTNYVSNFIDSIDIKQIMGFEIGSFLKGVLESIVTSLKLIFTTVFMYLFFKRLDLENKNNRRS